KSDHDLMRERPRLAAEVADVLHRYARLLTHLARDALLERLARLHEAGDERVPALREVGRSRHQDARSVVDEHDDRRLDPREIIDGARRASLRALGRRLRCERLPAAGAKLIGAIPIEDLRRAPGDRVLVRGHLVVERAQPGEAMTQRIARVVGDVDRVAVRAVEGPQELRALYTHPQRVGGRAAWNPRL